MWKYYDDWEQYKMYFKKYGCSAGICNMEPDVIDNATINYQMLQTLVDITDDELRNLAARSNYQLNHMASDTRTQLKCFGATSGNPERRYEQDALLLYPELLQDAHFRNQLREIRHSYIKQAKAGKLALHAKYLFVIPDLYAYCEWLFLGNKNPRGLLADGEIYAEQFPNNIKLDCLRSPHLYREHPVRRNVYADGSDFGRWFSKRGIYTSCHDLITKITMNDNDGDALLVCADKTLVEAAERNMRDIVPLYYEMGKAAAKPITNQSIFDGMVRAYSCGNIGPISNNITKIWNSENPDIDIIKILTMTNNIVIDSAKTLYSPTPPKSIKRRISSATNCQVPHFFIHAKDKTKYQVEDINESCVNRIDRAITRKHISFSGQSCGKFDYRMLMDNPLLIQTPDVEYIGSRYIELLRKLRFWEKPDEEDVDFYSYQYQCVRDEMFSTGQKESYIVDAIIHRIFYQNQSTKKRVFWGAFGDIVLNNLRKNLDKQYSDMILCRNCYSRFAPNDAQATCPHCRKRNADLKEVVCEDCGEVFYVTPNNVGVQKKCRTCYGIYRNKVFYDSKHSKKLATP